MAADEKEGEAIIPEEDFREAIAACCEDPLLKRYFQLAPMGAKLFIGLGFYSTHFGDQVDPRQYAECQAEIEPSLTVNDLKYLIRFEEDRKTKSYLKGLLAQREAAAVEPEAAVAGPEPAAAPEQKAVDGVPPVPRRRPRRRRARTGLQWVLRREKVRWLTFLLRAAVLAVLLAGGTVFIYLNRDRMNLDFWRKDASTPEARPVETAPTPIEAKDRDNPVPVQEKPGANRGRQEVATGTVDGPAETNAVVVQTAPAAAIASTGNVEAVAATAGPASVEAETNGVAAVDIAPGDTGEPEPVRPARRSRVVFTDGRKIVRHIGGKIEVPRRFSCLGAGIKPFWVYGPHPEVEAEKERKARLEWRSLAEQAKAADTSSRE